MRWTRHPARKVLLVSCRPDFIRHCGTTIYIVVPQPLTDAKNRSTLKIPLILVCGSTIGPSVEVPCNYMGGLNHGSQTL